MMKKTSRALISVVWVKQKNLSFYHWYPNRLEKKTTQFHTKYRHIYEAESEVDPR